MWQAGGGHFTVGSRCGVQNAVSFRKMANYYDADSELAYLNRTASVHPQQVSHELYDMLTFCVDCYTRTAGCFDVTIHSADYTPNLIRSVQLSPQERTLLFLQPGVTINLSGFLKGYALEKHGNYCNIMK